LVGNALAEILLLSTAEDATRAAQCAHSNTRVATRETLSIHFDTRCPLRRSQDVGARARSSHDRSQSSHGAPDRSGSPRGLLIASRTRSAGERCQLFVRFGRLLAARDRSQAPLRALMMGRLDRELRAVGSLCRAADALFRAVNSSS